MLKLLRLIRRDGLYYTSKRILAWFIAHSPLAYCASFSYCNNTRLVFAPTLLTYRLFANRDTRSNEREWICKQLAAGDTYIDVGANIGSLVIPAAATVGPTGTVLAFEPSPKFARVVHTNAGLNKFDWVHIYQVALGAKLDTVYLTETVVDDTTNHISSNGTEVAQKPLDVFTDSMKRIALLKVDVEGYEHEVLKGATKTLTKTEKILVECIPRNLDRAGTSVPELLNILTPHFVLYTRDADSTLKPFFYDSAATTWPDLIGINKTYVKDR